VIPPGQGSQHEQNIAWKEKG